MARMKKGPTHTAKLNGTLLDIEMLTYIGKTGANYVLIRKGSTVYLNVQCEATSEVSDDFGIKHQAGNANIMRTRLWEKAATTPVKAKK